MMKVSRVAGGILGFVWLVSVGRATPVEAVFELDPPSDQANRFTVKAALSAGIAIKDEDQSDVTGWLDAVLEVEPDAESGFPTITGVTIPFDIKDRFAMS